MANPSNPLYQIRWLPVRNTGAVPIPAFGLVGVVGVDSDGTLQVQAPSLDGQTGLLVVMEDLAAGANGQAHNSFPATVLYNENDGVPAVGDTWGVKAGDFLLRAGASGFLIAGGAAAGMVAASAIPGAPVPLPQVAYGTGGGVTGDPHFFFVDTTTTDAAVYNVAGLYGPQLISAGGTNPNTGFPLQPYFTFGFYPGLDLTTYPPGTSGCTNLTNTTIAQIAWNGWVNGSAQEVCAIEGSYEGTGTEQYGSVTTEIFDINVFEVIVDAVGQRVVIQGDIYLINVGAGLHMKVGTNCMAGTGTLSGGTATVSNTLVTSNSLIFLTAAQSGTSNLGALTVDSKIAGTSFTVKSSNASHAGAFNWLIIEPS